MSRSKKLGIAAAAAVAAALVIAVMHNAAQQELPEHTPGSAAEIQEHEPEEQETRAEEQEEIEVVLSEDILLSVAEEELGDTLTLSNLKIAFAEGNRFTVTGNADKAALSALLGAQNGSISSAYQSVLTLLPEELPFSMTVQLAAADGSVTARLQALSVSTMELPDDMLGEDWLDGFAEGINRELRKQLDTVTGMTSGIDGIIVTGTASGS